VHDSIRELPGSTPARKAIVSRALEYLDKLAGEGGNDMTLQTELAAGYERVGDVQGNPLGPNLGETSAAIESYKKALAIRERLFASADSENHYATAMLNSKLFRAAQFTGDFGSAESFCSRATSILEKLAESDPTNALYRVTAARFNQELADLLVSKTGGNVAEAMERYRKAIALTGSIAPSPRNDVAGPDGLSLNEKILSVTQMAHKRLGQRYELEGRSDEALEAYENALRESERLLAAGNPRKSQAEVVFAIALGNAGRMRATTGSADDGAQKVERGITICETAVNNDPKNVLARSELALLYWNAGKISLIRNNAADALKSFRKAEKLQQELVELNPKDLYNLANLADTYASIGSAYEMNRIEAEAFFKRSYEIWNRLKEKDMLPGYYAHKPGEVMALMRRATGQQ
jgi:tetratricopeptide (TPR) repeat protein